MKKEELEEKKLISRPNGWLIPTGNYILAHTVAHRKNTVCAVVVHCDVFFCVVCLFS